jgi:hypothetical protein
MKSNLPSLPSESATVSAFEIVDHGIEHSQFFQGCGTAFSRFDYVATGCGFSAAEAFSDALDQIACGADSVDLSAIERSKEGRTFASKRAEKANVYAHLRDAGEIKRRQDVPDGCELYYYVSVRYSLGLSEARLLRSAGLHPSQTGRRAA